MDRFYIACIIVGVLALTVCYLLYDRSGNRREIRNLRASVKCLQGIVDAHKQPKPIVMPDMSMMDAIQDAIRPEEQDYSSMIAPYESRKSRA